MDKQKFHLLEANGEIVLRPPKVKMIVLLIISVIFVALGIWMIIDNAPNGWFVVIFFGLCMLTFIIQFLPNSTFIRLTKEGFEMRSLFRSVYLRWEEARDFAPIRVGRNRLVGFNFTSSYKGTAKMRGLNSSLTGYESCTPVEVEINSQELAELMTKVRAASLGGSAL